MTNQEERPMKSFKKVCEMIDGFDFICNQSDRDKVKKLFAEVMDEELEEEYYGIGSIFELINYGIYILGRADGVDGVILIDIKNGHCHHGSFGAFAGNYNAYKEKVDFFLNTHVGRGNWKYRGKAKDLIKIDE